VKSRKQRHHAIYPTARLLCELRIQSAWSRR